MKLTFLGTRGEIVARTRRHRMHTSLLVTYRGRRVMVDCGADWLHRLARVHPHAIVLTHAHPDHASGLAQGTPCVVYATEATWNVIGHYPIAQRRTVHAGAGIRIGGVSFRPFPVDHSIRAPAVGYRIAAGGTRIFYVPDLVYIHDRHGALRDVRVYVGDGATLTRPLVRRRGKALIGHAPVQTQLGWCQSEGVPRAIITHCGSQIVAGDERVLGARLRRIARARGVRAAFAYDGMEVVLRAGPRSS